MKTLLEKELQKKPQLIPSVDNPATSTSQTKIKCKDEDYFGKTGEVEPTVRSKVTPQINPDDKDNLMTFSWQKLALLQCEYDPKSCSGCGRPSARLQQCVKCKVAKYCGKECQKRLEGET